MKKEHAKVMDVICEAILHIEEGIWLIEDVENSDMWDIKSLEDLKSVKELAQSSKDLLANILKNKYEKNKNIL